MNQNKNKQVHLSYRLNESLDEIKAAYEKFGYFSDIREEDLYLLASVNKTIIAIVRISVESDTAVLRGMYIDQQYHRQGIGRRMLNELSILLNEKFPLCYCVPFSHLKDFYGLIGFKSCDLVEAPTFLKERVEAYCAKGMNSILMKRLSV